MNLLSIIKLDEDIIEMHDITEDTKVTEIIPYSA